MLKTFYHWLILPSFDSRDVKIFSKGGLELCSQLNHRKDFLYSQIMGLNIILYWEACSHKFPVGVLDFFLCTVLQNILDVILILNLWRAFFSRLQLSIWGFLFFCCPERFLICSQRQWLSQRCLLPTWHLYSFLWCQPSFVNINIGELMWDLILVLQLVLKKSECTTDQPDNYITITSINFNV